MKAMNFNFLNRMRLWQKFALLGVVAAAAVAVPYYQFYVTDQEFIALAQEEQNGLPPVQAQTHLLQLVQQHRSLAALVLGGNEGASQARAAKQAEVDQAIAALDKMLASADAKAVKEGWAKIKQDWRQVAGDVTNRSTDTHKSFAAHTALAEESVDFLEVLGDYYKLTLDPTAQTYFMIQAALVHFPTLVEQYGQLRALGSGRLADAALMRAKGGDAAVMITATDRAQMDNLLRSATKSSDEAYRFVTKAFEAEPRTRAALEAEMAVPQEVTRQLAQIVRKELIDNPTPNFDAANFHRIFTEGIDAQFKFTARVNEVLDQELHLYVANLRHDLLVESAEVLAAALLAFVIALLTVRNITGTVRSLQGSVEKVRQGDFAALGAIASKDEVGDLGRTVNLLLQERIAAQQKAEAENETLNNSVISILQSVNQLSQRDLTAKAPVTQDIIGTVSDSINALTDETVKVLNGVSLIAAQVQSGSGKVKDQADLVSKTAEGDRQNVQNMIGALANATQTMNNVATLAEQSNASAEHATTATNSALETVNGTVKGMESIRETIAETEKRIKRLGERAQEITGIVNLINTISERTHVLALNASMQAAVAGEAGRGFAVVAEEVQRLAESSRNATQQIGTLVSNIQLETNETINTVNRTITQVVQGSEQAQKAGEQMRVTQDITAKLVAQVRRIAEGSQQQKEMSAQLLHSVQEIGKGNERTAQQIGAQNQETDTLLASARRLVESVNVFKLPQAA